MPRHTFDRRSVLKATGIALATGVAGCSGDSGDSGDDDTVPDPIDEFLSDSPEVGNYNNTIEDLTDSDEIVIKVGATGNGQNQAFAPVAATISTGTTIEWRWTGQGGIHNVVSEPGSDFSFDSGEPTSSRDPFTQTFDSTGYGLYVCEPHRPVGMRGAFEVV